MSSEHGPSQEAALLPLQSPEQGPSVGLVSPSVPGAQPAASGGPAGSAGSTTRSLLEESETESEQEDEYNYSYGNDVDGDVEMAVAKSSSSTGKDLHRSKQPAKSRDLSHPRKK